MSFFPHVIVDVDVFGCHQPRVVSRDLSRFLEGLFFFHFLSRAVVRFVVRVKRAFCIFSEQVLLKTILVTADLFICSLAKWGKLDKSIMGLRVQLFHFERSNPR